MELIVTLIFLLASAGVKSQIASFNDIENVNAQSNIFYFNKNSDCNGPKRELYDAAATIRGADISTVSLGPTTCEITLISEGQFQGTQLDIQVVAMNIMDCDVEVSIYEGEGAQSRLSSFDCSSSQNDNRRRVITSGNVATFIMTRKNPESVEFDVDIRVTPVRGGSEPGWENNYNRDNPFAFDKFDQEAIVGIVGGFYGLVFIICCIMVIYWYRVYNGLNKEWETHQLATLKTGSVFGTANPAPSQAWSVNLEPPASHMSRKTGALTDDWESTGVYNEERFETRRLTNERDGVRPRYANTNTSYAHREEDDPDHFQEKVITSRSRPINRGREARNSRPPSYAEAVSDDQSQQSTEDEEYSSDASVGKKSLVSEEASSRSRSSRSSRSEASTQSESEDSNGGSESSSSQRRYRRDRERRAKARRPPPAARGTKPKGKTRRDSSNASETGSNSTRPSRIKQAQHPPAPVAMGQMPYGAPGQFVPLMAAPIQMMPGYPPPQYPPETQPDMRPPPPNQVHPTDPPVYSYLVQRGYTPLDQNSAGSGGARKPEEPDTRLSSGVDYMRR